MSAAWSQLGRKAHTVRAARGAGVLDEVFATSTAPRERSATATSRPAVGPQRGPAGRLEVVKRRDTGSSVVVSGQRKGIWQGAGREPHRDKCQEADCEECDDAQQGTDGALAGW